MLTSPFTPAHLMSSAKLFSPNNLCFVRHRVTYLLSDGKFFPFHVLNNKDLVDMCHTAFCSHDCSLNQISTSSCSNHPKGYFGLIRDSQNTITRQLHANLVLLVSLVYSSLLDGLGKFLHPSSFQRLPYSSCSKQNWFSSQSLNSALTTKETAASHNKKTVYIVFTVAFYSNVPG